MVIFLLLGVLFFPSIIADEIKIFENGSVHWIIDGKEKEVDALFDDWINENKTVAKKNGTKMVLEAENTELKYIIESPLTTTIGKLEKETKYLNYQDIYLLITLWFHTIYE